MVIISSTRTPMLLYPSQQPLKHTHTLFALTDSCNGNARIFTVYSGGGYDKGGGEILSCLAYTFHLHGSASPSLGTILPSAAFPPSPPQLPRRPVLAGARVASGAGVGMCEQFLQIVFACVSFCPLVAGVLSASLPPFYPGLLTPTPARLLTAWCLCVCCMA